MILLIVRPALFHYKFEFIIVNANPLLTVKKIIEKSYETTKSMMQIMVIEITDRISFLSSGLWAATGCDLKDGKMAYYMPADITMPDLERIKDLLVVNRQHEAFIEILLCELEVTKTDIDRYFKIYQSKLNELNETLKCRTAVLMKTVFVSPYMTEIFW